MNKSFIGKNTEVLMLLSLLMIAPAANAQETPGSLPQWNKAMNDAEARSKLDQKQREKEDAKRLLESNKATSAEAAARQKEINAESGQYSATMRYANFLERATNTVPSPAKLRELYLKDLGEFKVTCETNRRSGTINYRVDGCQRTNLDAVFASLKQMPNRMRISAGTNSVSVAIKLPTAQ